MKQVWILNHYALEPNSAGGTRHFDLAANLLEHGWRATIIAASVEHPTGRQRLAPGERRRHEHLSGIPFLWLRTPEYKGNGMSRILNMFAYTWRVLLPASVRDLAPPDVVIGSSVHPLAALAGLVLARRHGVPFIFEVRDLWPQTLIDFGKLREHSIAAWMLRRLEGWLYRRAARIVVLLPYAGDYIASMGIAKKKVAWIPNGVEMSSFADSAADPACISRPDQAAPFELMYFGSHGQANGLEPLVRAMKLVAERVPAGDVRLRMIGDGPLKPQLMQLAQALGLDNISFEAAVPKHAIPALAAQADAFVITVVGLPRLYRFGISMNKLFDYLAAARPVIIASSAANNPVRDADAGLTVPPDDPEALAQAILSLYRMSPQERQRMGAAGRRHVEMHYSFDRLAARLAATLDGCLPDAARREAILTFKLPTGNQE
ncbi:MAG TPA: glycosyltransferase family 4 protein [Noviherbaspirillum sp.]|uniref:glycosyltransferase family 4 protein n=1 Tax=Noviherbaspirillum sp. TaxID=1926288 RepID=UPI002B46F018|nr:glycosyltransferase family 4 protein [Noviherbaspirillum sp.]HJV84460.1 glycosyltransferase family 4 protein [Noviherbaspirillum sp.]